MTRRKKRRDPGFPPRVPEELAELAEATMLLGNFARAGVTMRPASMRRLVDLIGALPQTPEQNAVWKSALKGLRKDLYELESR